MSCEDHASHSCRSWGQTRALPTIARNKNKQHVKLPTVGQTRPYEAAPAMYRHQPKEVKICEVIFMIVSISHQVVANIVCTGILCYDMP